MCMLEIASKDGAFEYPVWLHNIVVNPDVEVWNCTAKHDDVIVR